jgi:hypothetical protein
MSAKYSERLNNMISIAQWMGDGKVVNFKSFVERTQGTCQ